MRTRERALLGAVVIAAAVVVIVFAALQYRWSNEMREAAAVRLGDTLQLSMVNWHLDFLRNFSEVSLMLRAPSDRDGSGARYARELEAWRAIARYPDLVSGLYVASVEGGSSSLSRLDPAGRLVPHGHHATLDGLLRFLEQTPDASTLSSEDPPAGGRPGSLFVENYYKIGDALKGWRFEPNIPALLHARDPEPQGSERVRSSFVILELDERVIRQRILPDLAHRYFQGTHGLDYEVAVVSGTSPPRVIYESDEGFGAHPVQDADGRVNVFGRSSTDRAASAIEVFHSTLSSSGPATSMGIPWFPLVGGAGGESDWQLVVRHRRGGPLGAFVAGMHRRYLAISFGALLLLAVSMALVVVASNRAHRLAKLQMDFVTAVSHELRTPLTVISSAADNIAQGVVHDKEHVTQYGSVIAGQVRQLSSLVEQILDFAATREGRRKFTLRPLDVGELIDTAIGNTSGLIQAARFKVEREVDAALPQVTGDPVALAQCLQNLITNALKYSTTHRWIGIHARVGRGTDGSEVQVSVSDRGIGIDPSELSRVFEPFYRSPSVTQAQIHGTGLGLSVARGMAEAMKGRLSVTSEPGRGSTFTLHLPCADPSPRDAAVGQA